MAEIGHGHGAVPDGRPPGSWAGMCPGNNQSAGKRRSGRTTKGNRWLRQTLVQVAWAASHTKGTYLSAQYPPVGRAARQEAGAGGGGSHAAGDHLSRAEAADRVYEELGADFLDRLVPDRLTRQLVKRLEKLGHKVTLEPRQDAA